MNSDQNTRTNREQDEIIKRSKAGISPTTQAGAEERAAIANRGSDAKRTKTTSSQPKPEGVGRLPENKAPGTPDQGRSTENRKPDRPGVDIGPSDRWPEEENR
jgi:hypothetical protein